MKRNLLIKRFFAGFLLLLFVLSNMPRQTLHNIFADHTDDCRKNTTPGDLATSQLTIAGTHCQVDHLVVENPFVDNSIQVVFDRVVFFANNGFNPSQRFYSCTKELVSLRGPPSLA
ncbi:MAG: hypothetical protein JST81_12525 [Bacteroidetes bacterium]|nr:hypothetical protein [Bacteroidota bacterium]